MASNFKLKGTLALLFFGALALLILSTMMVVTVAPGHTAVGDFFGKVDEKPLYEGFHVVNPLKSWTHYDCRQKTHMEVANVPSQDQLSTEVDISVQYRLEDSMTPSLLQDTGTAAQAIEVHLIPKLRSILREQGKSIPRAEDFFKEEVQIELQRRLTASLKEYTEPRGLKISEVLIRDVRLPPFIVKAIESKKEREQEAEKQRAELDRFRTEQEQKVAQAEAERKAAEEEAQRQRILADARAYEIQKINSAISSNPAYVQLQALEALKKIAEDPAAKLYFIDGDANMPVPLMHMGGSGR
ncbi:MAG: SPFH domain-containing protein [Thermoanaerobaculia bacterium]|nr:SPFH domain-containing protein [Thermoanaerobaculia bacterium]